MILVCNKPKMNENNDISEDVMAVPSGVGSAVGVPEVKWYVARMTRNNVEKATAERLAKQGYETYVATQNVWRQWRNGRRRKVEHVVIPSMVFILCTEAERLIIAHDPNISRFLVDRASHSSDARMRKIVTIPDKQIQQLKFMLGESDTPIDFVEAEYKAGCKVRVIRGSFAGIEGEVSDMKSSKSTLTVVIKSLGSLKLSIDTINLELIRQ